MMQVYNSATPNILHYSGGAVNNHMPTGNTVSHESLSREKFDDFEQNVTDPTIKDEKSKKLVDDLNQISESLNIDVKFAYNDKIDEVYVSVLDKNTGKEIRKLPSEEAMKIKETMKDLVGSLLDTKG